MELQSLRLLREARPALLVGLLLAVPPASGQAREQPAEKAGTSLGIASVPNLRDLGGYRTTDGRVVRFGLVYRSDQLSDIPPADARRLEALKLANDYDLRTDAERDRHPDAPPPGVAYRQLNVLADASQAGPAQLEALLKEPKKANAQLGGGRVEAEFEKGYRQFVSLPSARRAYRALFLALGDRGALPAVFHCTTGKDRTGWAAAAFLSLMGVPRDQVMADYLRSNDYILPAYQPQIDAFVAAGGDPEIPRAILGVRPAYLEASFDEMEQKYGSIENYFAEGLGIDADRQEAMKALYLERSESAHR